MIRITPDTPSCPICGRHHLHVTEWPDDEYQFIECGDCSCGAPIDVWMSIGDPLAIRNTYQPSAIWRDWWEACRETD